MAADVKLVFGTIDKVGNVVTINDIKLSDGTKVAKKVSLAAGTATKVNLETDDKTKKYGTLNMDKDGNLTLVGGANLTGKVEFGAIDGSYGAKLTEVSFGAPVDVSLDVTDPSVKDLKKVTGSTKADKIAIDGYGDDFVLNAGAGNDSVNVIAGKANVALGAGKDVVSVKAGAEVALTDYNFADDIILNATALNKDGEVTAGGKVTGVTNINSVYIAKTTDGSDDKAKVSVLATAEEVSKVAIDASSVSDENVIINTTAADSANVTLGNSKKVTVRLGAAGNGVDTLNISSAAKKTTVDVTNFAADDVLNFDGLTFANSDFEKADGTVVKGDVSVNLGGNVINADGYDVINFADKTLYAATGVDKTIDLSAVTDLSKVLVKGINDVNAGTTTITTKDANFVNLSDINMYHIDKVALAAGTVAKASVAGTRNKAHGISIDAGLTTEGVAVWTNNDAKVGDSVKLGAGEDTLYVATTDGTEDVVHSFSLANDSLYLLDADSMKVVGGKINVGAAKVGFDALADAAEEIVKVQGAKFAGTAYVAGDYTNDDTIKLGVSAGKVNYYAIGKDAKIEVTDPLAPADPAGEINYTFLKDTIAYGSAANIAAGGSVASINASGVAYTDSKIVVEGVANVSVGAGTNQIWVNGAASNGTVMLGVGHKGDDTVYFGTTDKNVEVQNYDSESDTIFLFGNTMNYTAKAVVDGANVNTEISSSTGGKLTVTNGAKDGGFVKLADEAGNKYHLFTNSTTYTTNIENNSQNIYLGQAELTADGSVTDATTLVVADGVNKWGLNSTSYVDKTVKTIDMSGSTAEFVLVGSGNTATSITGGTTTNYLNGGGASKDVLIGVASAVDNFYVGMEDGNDTLLNVGAEDIVQLYDVATTDIKKLITDPDNTATTIILSNDNKLQIDCALVDGVTFALKDATFKYDSTAEDKWVKQ